MATQTDVGRLAASIRFLRSSSEGFFRHLDVDFADLLDGQQALGDQALRDDRLELVEENVDGVNLAAV
jgi:hypothetical protein